MVSAAAQASDGSENPGAYFRRTKLHWMTVIGTGLALYTWATFSPETVPYTYLGPIGTFLKYMVTNHYTLFKIGYYGSLLIHVIEAFYSFKIFKDKGITDRTAQLKWTVQTLIFGFGSFALLLIYNPQKKR